MGELDKTVGDEAICLVTTRQSVLLMTYVPRANHYSAHARDQLECNIRCYFLSTHRNVEKGMFGIILDVLGL